MSSVPLEVVGHSSETKLQVDENLLKITWCVLKELKYETISSAIFDRSRNYSEIAAELCIIIFILRCRPTTLEQCRARVSDAGPTLYQRCVCVTQHEMRNPPMK